MPILAAMAQSTFKTTRQIDRQEALTRRRPIELQTENNFCIIRCCDVDEQNPRGGTKHCFIVRDPYSYELDVTVNFSEASVVEAIRRSCGRLTLESAFWLICAERHLADYLWDYDDYPPDARITIDYLTPDDVDLARRWRVDDSLLAGNESLATRKPSPDGDASRIEKSHSPQITFLTENGYSVVRLCEVDQSIADTPQECHFRVTDSDGEQREVNVCFVDGLINELQRRRRKDQLAVNSKYWLIIAEKYLADYLWRKDCFPANRELRIEQLSDDDLLLGAHWHDDEMR